MTDSPTVSGEHPAEYEQPSDQGICDLCEAKPCQPDDCFCAECRDGVTARSDTVVDPVEIVLSEHGRLHFLSDLDKQVCNCGWECESGPGLHRRHVAAYIYEVLGLDGPQPWVIGSESTMRPLMEEAGQATVSGREGVSDA